MSATVIIILAIVVVAGAYFVISWAVNTAANKTEDAIRNSRGRKENQMKEGMDCSQNLADRYR